MTDTRALNTALRDGPPVVSRRDRIGREKPAQTVWAGGLAREAVHVRVLEADWLAQPGAEREKSCWFWVLAALV